MCKPEVLNSSPRAIYHFNSRLAHFNTLLMEYIYVRFELEIMAEYPVMSTSQGTYVRIEQTSEVIRVTYEICRARGLELRTAGVNGGGGAYPNQPQSPVCSLKTFLEDSNITITVTHIYIYIYI